MKEEKPKIIVEIDDNGVIDIHVEGCSGEKCVALTSELVKKLGTTEKMEKTEEYYKPAYVPIKPKKKVKT